MPNLKQSLTKQRISALFLLAQQKLVAIRQSSHLADNEKSEFNAFIGELIFLAEQGDKKQQLPAYPQWFQQHQAIIGQWLADPEVSDENMLRLRIKLATNCQTLIQAIRLYPREITSISHNLILQKEGLVQAIIDLWYSEKKREIITNLTFNWEGSLITRQFGIRAQIIYMAQAEFCSSDETQFVEKIGAATTYPELAQSKSLDNIEVAFPPSLTFAFPAMNKNSCEQVKPAYLNHHDREKMISSKRMTL